jgi:hypothetical protein
VSLIVTDRVPDGVVGRAFGFSQRETDMTIQDAALQVTAVEPAHPSPLASDPLARSEPRALIAILSVAKRNALVACFNASGLHKKNGAWHGAPDGKPVSGVTVADLARDGMLTLTTDHRLASARLTERGNWFARTLLREAAAGKNKAAVDGVPAKAGKERLSRRSGRHQPQMPPGVT